MPLPKLFRKLQEFILVWPGDEMLQITYDGQTFFVPPFDQVAQPGPGSPYHYPAARDANGQGIPGTIAIKDQVTPLQTGGYRKTFDALECCTWIEENRVEMLNQGLSIVMDAVDVAASLKDGRERYDRSQDDLARITLQQELERRKKWEAKGVPAPPSSSERKVLWAVKHLETAAQRRPALSEAAIRAVLGGQVQAPTPPPAPVEAPKRMFHDQPVDEMTAEDVFSKAEAAGLALTKNEMLLLLKGEGRKEILERIAEKYEGARAAASA